MENYIPVLTPNRRPLAPCHPNRAKGLVHQEKASFRHRSGIRIIILNKTKIPKVKRTSRVQIRMDPGAKTTGIAITRNYPDGTRDALMTLEITHQGRTVSRQLTKHRQLRRNRHYRKTRYRQPQFNNRTRAPGWLPPSLRSRRQNTLTWVRRLAKLLPIQDILIETSIFDPQLLRNPEIKGTQYQQGPLYQTNLRSAVLQRDGNKCAYCDRSGKRRRLELDHAIPKSQGGPDRYDNLVAACRTCNQKRKNLPLEQWLRRRPKKLATVNAKLGMDLASATHMNIILPNLLKALRQDGWNVTDHPAATTAAGRLVSGIEKSHHGDAAVTGCPTGLNRMPTNPITITATGRGNRQRMMPDRHGTPNGKDHREYCKLPRETQRQTPTPSHKKRAKQVGGVATGDYVKFNHEGTKVHGYGTISHEQVALTKPKWKSTKAERATALERNHGYQVTYPKN